MMDAVLARVEEVYCAAAEIEEPLERSAFLDRTCAGDSALRSVVEAMLAELEQANRFMADATAPANLLDAVAAAPDFQTLMHSLGGSELAAETQIGRYKLLQKLGEGGCGVVYLAEQEMPVRRQVALKIIKLGMDTRSVIARFEAERQALALMDHPNIASVLDAGATSTGRPYFVMELVRGTKITAYCDEHQLNLRQRLGLFIQVCHAIQHAHQKGIIHRDIKPSNILVPLHDSVPVPKVIDFGIAKATSGQVLTDKTVFTSHDHFIGTPAYMSPEQAEGSGLDVDTRSDIYSLGVLLYELLTSKTPFDQSELIASGYEAMRRTLCECEPVRPSGKLNQLNQAERKQTADRRQSEPHRLKSLLAGDLDWVVMKALEKDRNRRYQTANGLAMDLQRYLNDEPVSACPPGRVYRLSKLIRRNRATFTAVGAVSLALIAGFGTSMWLFFRERAANREQLRLRNEADARAEIARAAVSLSRSRPEEADALVERIQIPVTEPSLEAASVFRRLGLWHVEHRRWDAAAQRMTKLLQANQVDKTDLTDEATRDLLFAGPTFVAAGKTNEYRVLVQNIITRFAATPNPIAAEQALKVSLILPADQRTIRSLAPMATVARSSLADSESTHKVYMEGWQMLAITLFEYRSGNVREAEAWARKGLALEDQTPSRIAMTRILRAGALHRMNGGVEAREELEVAARMISLNESSYDENKIIFGTDRTGLWHDWVIAKVLLNEMLAGFQPMIDTD